MLECFTTTKSAEDLTYTMFKVWASHRIRSVIKDTTYLTQNKNVNFFFTLQFYFIVDKAYIKEISMEMHYVCK